LEFSKFQQFLAAKRLILDMISWPL